MCASQLSTILYLLSAVGAAAEGAYGTSCSAAPLKGFAALKDGALVDGAGEPFVFASMNLPNIHRIELPEGGVRKPTLAEVADGLCSVQQMKGRVARTYVLSHGDGDLYHIDGGTVNEGWFAVLDQVIEVAEQLGVYVIIPFVNTFWYEHWGTTAYYAQWSGQDPSKSIDFFHDETQQAVFRGVLTAVLERTNSRTGRQYKDEPAILAWETGNELVDVRYGAESGVPPPAEWTEGVAAHLRAHGAQQLIMDGAQFTSASLPLAGIDLVGRTYYNLPASALENDLALVETWNEQEGATPKLFVVKEFGLVSSVTSDPNHNRTLAVPQTDAWVGEMVNATMTSAAAAGILYWSLRTHADEGGFHVHYEEGGLLQALHWPGFSNGYPDYEIEIFELLRTTNGVAAGAYSVAAPTLLPPDVEEEEVTAPPCLSFVGVAGAAFYELWGQSETSGGWIVVAEDVKDDITPRSSVVSLAADTLTARLGASAATRFCLRACADRDSMRLVDPSTPSLSWAEDGHSLPCFWSAGAECERVVPPHCSNCSEEVVLDLSEAPPPASNGTCASIPWSAPDYTEKFYEWESLLAAHQTPDGAALALTVLVILFIVLCAASAGAPVASKDEKEAKATRDAQLIALRMVAVVGLVVAAAVALDAKEETPRFDDGWGDARAEWGAALAPLLFAVAGFTAALKHADTAADDEVHPLLKSELCAAYPPFFFTTLASLAVALTRGAVLTGRYVLMFPFCAAAWSGPLRLANEANALSWIIGALLFDGIFKLPILVRVRQSSGRMLGRLLLISWLCSLWVACFDSQITVFVLDRLLTFVVLGPQLPAFVFGILLGCLHLLHAEAGMDGGAPLPWHVRYPTAWAHRGGLSAATVAVGLIVALTPTTALSDFMIAWGRAGMLLPFFGIGLLGVAGGRDPLCALLSSVARPLAPAFEILWQPMLLCAHPLWYLAAATTTTAEGALAAFALMLPCVAAAIDLLIRRPCEGPMRGLLDGALGAVRLADKGSSAWERLIMYYGGMAGVFGFFLSSSIGSDSQWVVLADLSGAPDALQGFLYYTSWLLAVPLLALGMGLVGQVLYPCVVRPDAVPVKQQLAKLAKADADADAAGDPAPIAPSDVKLYWRVVTRGLSPDLVAANVHSAFAVLKESGLPRERWEVEVVCDNAMGLPERTGTEVLEVVVPSDYKCPNGGKFKARALHWGALHGSSARRHDWIIHMDEETRFDVDTVCHVLEHCLKEHQLYARGGQKWGHIGQGVIVYNTTEIESTLCSLADTIRVGDDFGKFALQYRMFEDPLIGMHGSFVVCQNAVEIDFGFDHGVEGSITEDTFFAMHIASHGVKVKWCEGHMFEQSPFNVEDFAKQRCRWYAGLWLCVKSKNLALWRRVFLGAHVASWALCPLLNIINWMNILLVFSRPLHFRVFISVLYAIPCFGYTLGFCYCFSPSNLTHGVAEWLMLLLMQVLLIPLYAAFEAYGIVLALIAPWKKFAPMLKKFATEWFGGKKKRPSAQGETAFTGFKLVQKQGKDAAKRAAEMEAAQEAAASDAGAHWKKLLVGAPAGLPLPLDKALAPVAADADAAFVLFPEVGAAALRAHADRLGVTAVDVAAAALAWVAAVHARETDIMILVEGRRPTLLRLDASPTTTLGALATEAAKQGGAALKNPMPFLDILALGPADWATAERPLPLHLSPKSMRARAKGPSGAAAGAVFTLHVPRAGAVALAFDADAIAPQTASRWAERLARCVLVAPAPAGAPQRPLSEVPLMGLPELHSVVIGANMTAAAHPGLAAPHDATVHAAFEAAAMATPNATALSLAGSGERVTYANLLIRAKALAGALNSLNVLSEDARLVALIFDRSVEMVVAIFGVLFAGAAYLPIEPSFPAARVVEILGESRAPLALVQTASYAALTTAPAEDDGVTPPPPLVLLSDAMGAVRGLDGKFVQSMESAAPLPCGASDLVYVMYTSGTTGKPKGVQVGHGPLMMRTSWMQSAYEVRMMDVVPFKTSFIFGVSEWELFWTLTHSATLLVVSDAAVRSPTTFARLLVEHRVSVCFLIPSHVDALLDPLADAAAHAGTCLGKVLPSACLPSRRKGNAIAVAEASDGPSTPGAKPDATAAVALRHVVCCGEALSSATVARFYAQMAGMGNRGVEIHNLYGPTEGSMTWHRCARTAGAEVLIGSPIDNTTVLLVDERMRPVPIGVPGEICFGSCIASGYLNRPDLTDQKFVRNPYWPDMRIVPTAAASDDGEFAANNPVSAAAAAGGGAEAVAAAALSSANLPSSGGSRALDALVEETIDMQLGSGMLSGALADAAAGVGGGRGSLASGQLMSQPELGGMATASTWAAINEASPAAASGAEARDTLVELTVPTPSPPPSPPGEAAPGTAPLPSAPLPSIRDSRERNTSTSAPLPSVGGAGYGGDRASHASTAHSDYEPPPLEKAWIDAEYPAAPVAASGVPPSPLLYRTGDLAVRLPSGELRFLGRADRQVKVRGYRIELEAVEAVLKDFRPPLAKLAAVAVDAGGGRSELVAFVLCEAVLGAAERPGGLGLLAFCRTKLPAYMVPSRVVALEAFPTLPNGKTNLNALKSPSAGGETVEAATDGAAAAGSTMTDSLGMVRALSSGQAERARETGVADALRAVLMYGVIMDHWAGCADGSSCRLVMEGIVWRQPQESQRGLLWIDTLVRMIGNYKCMSGFLMVSAYVDAGFVDATRFGRGDAVALLTYLQMIWVLDPLAYVMCSAAVPDLCYAYPDGRLHNQYAGVHRWYLLLMMLIKATLVAFRVLHLPPLAQCVLVTAVGFAMHPEALCLTDAKCASSATDDGEVWWALQSALKPLFTVLFMGPYEDAFNMSSSVLMRYYVLFGAQYLWVFHFGRPALKWLLAPVAAAAATDGKGKKFLMRAPLLHAAGAFVHPLKLKQIPLSGALRRLARASTASFLPAMKPKGEESVALSGALPAPDLGDDDDYDGTEADSAFLPAVPAPLSPMSPVEESVDDDDDGDGGGGAGGEERRAKLAARRALLTRVAALVGVVSVELYVSAMVGPALYNLMQEDAVGSGEPQLMPTLGVFALLTLAVLLLVVALAKPQAAGAKPWPPPLVKLAGSTTLGCYVLHMYFTLPLSLIADGFAAIPGAIGYGVGAAVQLILLLALPLAFQLTIGAGFHRLLMLELKICFKGLAKLAALWQRVAAKICLCSDPRNCRRTKTTPRRTSSGSSWA